MADPRWRIQDGGCQNKENYTCRQSHYFFSRIYRKYVILTWKPACNSLNFIYIYDFSEVMVKYEFSK